MSIHKANDEDVVFFYPGEVVFVVEHDEPLSESDLIEFVLNHEALQERYSEILHEADFDRELIQTFPPSVPYEEDAKQSPPPPRTASLRRRKSPFDMERKRQFSSMVYAKMSGDYAALSGTEKHDNDDNLIDLISQIDHDLRKYERSRQDEGPLLRTCAPDWLSGGAPHHIGTGGPGAWPREALFPETEPWFDQEAPNPEAPFAFGLERFPYLQNATGKGVQVAILDTAWSEECLKEKYEEYQEHNPLLRSLLGENGQFKPGKLKITRNHDTLFDELNKDNDGYDIFGHQYRMIDHGLFIAGIIHTIAPEAEIHLIRVLNDYGVGTVFTILDGLQTVIKWWDRSKPLIVNMSFTLATPMRLHRKPSRIKKDRPFYDSDFLKRTTWTIESICQRLHDEGALLVAAAGNDAESTDRPEARMPASFDSVIGVGALDKEGKPAHYSNLSDSPPRTGLITFGGVSQNQQPGVKEYADKEKGMLGVYIGKLPENGTNRESDAPPQAEMVFGGWARWAGTSFSTPIVSGLLALLRSTVYTPEDALQKLYQVQPDETPYPGNEEIISIKQGKKRTR